MFEIAILELTGKSGAIYNFEIFSNRLKFKQVAAVYAVTKLDRQGNHAPIYIGKTNDLEDNFIFHRKQTCFDKKGATHICVHLDSTGESRKAKEADPLAAYDWPCND